MSQKSLLIAFAIAIVLMVTIEAEAKRIGCASFGHSCYGGHGKRSDPSVVGEEIEAADQPSIPMRVLQRRFSFQPDTPTNEGTEHEKEVKLLILGVLSEVVSEAMKKSAGTDQDTLA